MIAARPFSSLVNRTSMKGAVMTHPRPALFVALIPALAITAVLGAQDAATPSEDKPGTGAWANYDFVPGEQVLFYEDFADDRVGDDVGDDASNLALSEQRAAAVKTYLVDTFQMDAARLETAGLGESAPAVPNTSPEARQQNRRVELVRMEAKS
jgi:hypothetical protein